LIDNLILTEDFSHFISFFSEQQEKDMEWEYFLHKVFDMSFNEFKESITIDAKTVGMSKSDLETTIQNSMSMTINFIPPDSKE
jgi:hypothetical protein